MLQLLFSHSFSTINSASAFLLHSTLMSTLSVFILHSANHGLVQHSKIIVNYYKVDSYMYLPTTCTQQCFNPYVYLRMVQFSALSHCSFNTSISGKSRTLPFSSSPSSLPPVFIFVIMTSNVSPCSSSSCSLAF